MSPFSYALPPRSGGEGRFVSRKRCETGWGVFDRLSLYTRDVLAPVPVLPPPPTPPRHSQELVWGGEVRGQRWNNTQAPACLRNSMRSALLQSGIALILFSLSRISACFCM